MIKTRLYENDEFDISKIVDKTLYDAILLENQPYSTIDYTPYLAVLTKRRESSRTEKAGEWILKIFMRDKSGRWQLTPGQWYLKTLLGYDEYNSGGFLDEDSISIDGTPNWKVYGMFDIIQEAIEKTQAEFEEENNDYNEVIPENKEKDYSKMKKWELEKLMNQALDNKDYDTLNKIYKYLPEEMKTSFDNILNEKLVNSEEQKERSIDLKGPSGNVFVIIGMAKDLTRQLSHVDPETYNWKKIHDEMTSGDYKNAILTFEKYFGDYVTIYNADVLDENKINTNDMEKINESFKTWYEENKDSETLRYEYEDAMFDMPRSEKKSFKDWCKQQYEWMKENGEVDESIKHMKPRSKEEILRNMKNDPELEKDDDLDESLNEKESTKQILMGHNSPNPNDPEVNGLAYRIESEEELRDEIGESAYINDDMYIMPRLFEEEHQHITKSYDKPMTREDVRQMVGKMLMKYQRDSKFNNITNMNGWLDKNNFGSYQHNRWVRAAADTLFKKVAGTWIQINTNLSLDQLTDKVMNYWQNKMKNESISSPTLKKSPHVNEGCGCGGAKKKPTFTPAPKKRIIPQIRVPKSK